MLLVFGASSATAEPHGTTPPTTLQEDAERANTNMYDEMEFSDGLYGVLPGRALFSCKMGHSKTGSLHPYWNSFADYNGLNRSALTDQKYYMLSCEGIEFSEQVEDYMDSISTGIGGANYWFQGLLIKRGQGFECETCRLFIRTSDVSEISQGDSAYGKIRIAADGHIWLLPSPSRKNPDASIFQIMVGEHLARDYHNYMISKADE